MSSIPLQTEGVRTPASRVVAGTFFLIYNKSKAPAPPRQRTLTRLTFDDGLQFGATWSPDSRFIAYSSDRGGKFDIWVQQVSGGDPVQVTKGPGDNWQRDWSPDGKYITYRSEEGDGGLFIIPALGGAGLEKRLPRLDTYPVGLLTARGFCFNQPSLQGPAGFMWWVLMEERHVRSLRNLPGALFRSFSDIGGLASRRPADHSLGLGQL